MSKKLDYSRIRRDRARKINIKDENESRSDDRAARWLKKVEESQKPK